MQKKKSYCETNLGADFRFRSSVFFKTVVLKNFAKVTGKQLRGCLFLIKLQAHSNFLLDTALAICSNFQQYLV